MMDINKQKQAKIKSFHTWLESYLGIKIDEMKVKTQVRAFYDRSFDEYYKVLKRSEGKLELKILNLNHIGIGQVQRKDDPHRLPTGIFSIAIP